MSLMAMNMLMLCHWRIIDEFEQSYLTEQHIEGAKHVVGDFADEMVAALNDYYTFTDRYIWQSTR